MPTVALKLFTGQGTGWIDGRTDKAVTRCFASPLATITSYYTQRVIFVIFFRHKFSYAHFDVSIKGVSPLNCATYDLSQPGHQIVSSIFYKYQNPRESIQLGSAIMLFQ